jgi:dipeptidase D
VVVADETARDAIVAGGVHAVSAYATTDPAVRVTVAPAGGAAAPGVEDNPVDAAVPHPPDAWTAEASARIVDLIATLPVGPLRMSAEFPGVVETSSSLGGVATDDGRLSLHCLSRSANDGAIGEVTLAIAAAGRLAGAEVELGREYPGWQPDLSSPVLATARTVHELLFRAEPEVTLVHGGLGAAIIAAKRPGIDAISFGPQIEGPHAPGERLHAGSASRFMRLLAALLDELSRP